MYSGVAKLCHDSYTTGICRSTGRSAMMKKRTNKCIPMPENGGYSVCFGDTSKKAITYMYLEYGSNYFQLFCHNMV